MTPSETVDSALALARARYQEAPHYELYASVLRQLEYVAAVLGGQADKSRLGTIIVGHYAVRELESDEEFCRLLCDVQALVSKMTKGLKLD